MDNVDTPFDDGDVGIFGRENLGRDGYLLLIPSLSGPKSYRIETAIHGPAIENFHGLEYFIKESRFSHWFRDATIISKHMALMEMYPPMKKPYKGNTIFLGESAVMAETLYAGATMCGYKGALAVVKELSGERGFEEYTDWWNTSAFEMTKDMEMMAEYGKRFLFNSWMGSDVMDSLFELAEKSPFIVDEFIGNPYDFARSIIEHLQSLPGVKPEWKEKLEGLKHAKMSAFSGVTV
jgi:flavin-dependent dehydrogenase